MQRQHFLRCEWKMANFGGRVKWFYKRKIFNVITKLTIIIHNVRWIWETNLNVWKSYKRSFLLRVYSYVASQYAHDVVLTSIRRCFNVMDVVWTSKRRRVLTGIERLKELRCLNILMSEKLVGRKFFGRRVFLL